MIEIADGPAERERTSPQNYQRGHSHNHQAQNQFHPTNPFGHNAYEKSVDNPSMHAPLRTSTLIPSSTPNSTHNSLPRINHIENSVHSQPIPAHMGSTQSSRAKQVDHRPPKSHHEPKSRADQPVLERQHSKSKSREKRNGERIDEQKRREKEKLKSQALKRTNESKHKKVDTQTGLFDSIQKPDGYQDHTTNVRRGSGSSAGSHQVTLLYFMIHHLFYREQNPMIRTWSELTGWTKPSTIQPQLNQLPAPKDLQVGTFPEKIWNMHRPITLIRKVTLHAKSKHMILQTMTTLKAIQLDQVLACQRINKLTQITKLTMEPSPIQTLNNN